MKKIEMTQGSLWKNILLFSVPLMLTQVLEVLFNLSDVAVVGKFASYQALKQETATLRDRREEARRMRGEKASDKKRGQGGRPGRGKRRR